MYSGSGAAVSGDSALTDSGTTLSYSGSGGISATAGNVQREPDGEWTADGGGAVDGEFAGSGNGDERGGGGDVRAGNFE